MKENVKAALLSAVVLPGVGQLYRGRLVKGGILVVLVTIMLLIFAVLAVLAIQDVLQVTRVSGSVDAVAVAERLRGRLPAATVFGGIFFCIWVYGVVDAFFCGGSGSDAQQGD